MATVCALLIGSITGRLQASENTIPATGFLGFTNLPQGPHALFWLTNHTTADIAVAPIELELRQGDLWSTNKFFVAASKPVRKWQARWIGWREELKPQEGFTFSVPLLATNAPWRVTFYCAERALVTDAVKDVIRHVRDNNTSSKGFTGTVYKVKTPIVQE